MPIVLVPIRFGYQEDGVMIGWTAFDCRYCRTLQPAACFDVSRCATIYGIKLLLADAELFSARKNLSP